MDSRTDPVRHFRNYEMADPEKQTSISEGSYVDYCRPVSPDPSKHSVDRISGLTGPGAFSGQHKAPGLRLTLRQGVSRRAAYPDIISCRQVIILSLSIDANS